MNDLIAAVDERNGSELVSAARSLSQTRLVGLPRRWAHVQGVAAAARAVVPRLAPDMTDSVTAAAFLHDIGYAEDLAVTGFHPVDGARFIRELGFPSLVVSLVAHHTGARVEAEERGLTAELDEFLAPPSDLLDIVTYADLTTTPIGEPTTPSARISEILTRYEPGTIVHQAVTRSRPALMATSARVQQRLEHSPTLVSKPRPGGR